MPHNLPRTGGGEHAAPAVDSRRSWAILIVAFLAATVGLYNQLTVSALGPEVAATLEVSTTQLSSLMMAPMLTGVLGLAAGGLADRYGVKRVVAAAFAVSIAGAVLRVFADTYAVYFVAMLLMGLVANTVAANIAKIVGGWFSAKRVGAAMGLFMASGAVGTVIAQTTSARFPSARAVYVFGAALFVVLLVAWMVVVPRRSPVSQDGGPAASVGASLGAVVRNPHVWLIAVGMFLFLGTQMTFSSFLPTALTVDKGVDLAQAGALASLYTVGAVVGSLTIPALAARTGRMKPAGVVVALVGMAAMYLSWLAAPGAASAVVLLVAGAMLGAASALIMAAPALLPSVGPRFAGSAGGLVSTLQTAGGFAVPTFVIAPIAGTDYTLLVILSAACAGLIAVTMLFVPEYGRRPGGARRQSAAGAAA